MEQATEKYDINNEDSELHLIDLITKAMERHLPHSVASHGVEEVALVASARLRVLNYLIDRVTSQ